MDKEMPPSRQLEGPALSDVLEALPAGVLVLDSQGVIREASRAFGPFLGKDVNLITTREVDSEGLLAGEVLTALREICGTTGAVNQVVHFDRSQRHYIHIWALPKGRAEGLEHTIVFLLDVTGLIANSDLISSFVQQIRHDLGSPLTALRGGIELLLTERMGRLQEPQKKLLRVMERGAESIVEIVSLSKRSEEETAEPPVRTARRG